MKLPLISLVLLCGSLAVSNATVYNTGFYSKNETITAPDGFFQINNTNINGAGVGFISSSGTMTLQGGFEINSASQGVLINVDNAHIVLETLKGDDSMIINSSGSTQNGIIQTTSSKANVSITIDVTKSDDPTVYINGTTSSTIKGIYLQSGANEILGNVEINTKGQYGGGIYGLGSSQASPSLNVSGNATVNTQGANGVELRVNSDVHIGGDLNITSAEMGIYSFIGSTLTVDGSLGITSKRGMEATNGTIILNGIHHIDISPNASVIDAGSNADGHTGTVIGQAGVYKFSGKLSTSSNGLIDMDMREDSDYVGFTSQRGGEINISLSDTSKWTLSADSTMTDLNVYEGASVLFTISGAPTSNKANFTDITAAAMMLRSGSIIDVTLNGYNPILGDAFQLVLANLYDVADPSAVTYRLDALTDGLSWDTSTFHLDGTIRVIASPVPEPATASLLALGMAACLLRRRK